MGNGSLFFKSTYYSVLKVQVVARYTLAEAMYYTGKTGHYGRWDE